MSKETRAAGRARLTDLFLGLFFGGLLGVIITFSISPAGSDGRTNEEFCGEFVINRETDIQTNSPGIGPAPEDWVIRNYEACVEIMSVGSPIEGSTAPGVIADLLAEG